MFEQLSQSVRRLAGAPPISDNSQPAPLVRLGDIPADAVHAAQVDIGSLRGMTPAAADVADCTCPEPCERDHANE